MDSNQDSTLPGSMVHTVVDADEGADPAEAPRDPDALAAPARIGRFVVLRRIGVGSMGVVYAAYDEQLDRRVAIKVLTDSVRQHHQDRLRREAQALARLSHPNVVQVYEVGTHEGRIFLAMELVEGQSLRHWLEGSARDHTEIVSVFVQAGRGLAAAHAAGLVHRDFKPANVVLGDDGRVRVLDFGLAMSSIGDSLDEDSSLDDGGPSASASFQLRLTRTGALLGTPAYMSPEQIAAESLTPASDQFSFCIALYEALAGQHPFDTESLARLSLSISEARLREPAEGGRISPRLRAVLVRGLAKRPEDRWPSMEDMLAQLEHDPSARRRWAWGVAAAASLGIGAYALGAWSSAEPTSGPCGAAAQELQGVWDPERRDAVERALLATDLGYASDTWTRTEARLDAYADAWVESHQDACEATHVRRTQSPILMDLRLRCLGDRRRELSALVDVLATADAQIASRAVRAARELPRVDRCNDEAHVRAQIEPPDDPETQIAVEELRVRLSRASALERAAKHDEGIVEARAVLERALELDYTPLVGLARLQLGRLLTETGALDQAEASLRDAYVDLIAVGDDASAARAGLALVQVLVKGLERPDEAEWLLLHTRGTHRRIGSGDAERSAVVLMEASLAVVRERFDEAESRLREALEMLERSVGPNDLRYSEALIDLGVVLWKKGEYEGASRQFRRAIEIDQTLLGPDHPDLLQAMVNLSETLRRQARYDEAIEVLTRALELGRHGLSDGHIRMAGIHLAMGNLRYERSELPEAQEQFERAVEIRRATLGPEHPQTLDARTNLATVLHIQAKHEEAIAQYRALLAIYERSPELQRQAHADVLNNLGSILESQGQPDEALRLFERSLSIGSEIAGPRTVKVSHTLANMSGIYFERGDYERARSLIEQALAIRRETLGEKHPKVAGALRELGLIDEATGQRAAAIAHLREALAIEEATLDREHQALAETRAALERVLRSAGDHAAADALAEAGR